MFDYIKGKIVEVYPDSIVLDIMGIGYKVFVASPYSFEIDKEYKVFIFNSVKEEENILYGFAFKEERELFYRLISVKGLGPKTALPMLATGSINGIVDAIDRENILYLKKFPKIGEKLARQIILDLKGKLSKSDNSSDNEELLSALTSLGYKYSDLKTIISKVNKEDSIEMQIKEALRLLLK